MTFLQQFSFFIRTNERVKNHFICNKFYFNCPTTDFSIYLLFRKNLCWRNFLRHIFAQMSTWERKRWFSQDSVEMVKNVFCCQSCCPTCQINIFLLSQRLLFCPTILQYFDTHFEIKSSQIFSKCCPIRSHSSCY